MSEDFGDIHLSTKTSRKNGAELPMVEEENGIEQKKFENPEQRALENQWRDLEQKAASDIARHENRVFAVIEQRRKENAIQKIVWKKAEKEDHREIDRKQNSIDTHEKSILKKPVESNVQEKKSLWEKFQVSKELS